MYIPIERQNATLFSVFQAAEKDAYTAKNRQFPPIIKSPKSVDKMQFFSTHLLLKIKGLMVDRMAKVSTVFSDLTPAPLLAKRRGELHVRNLCVTLRVLLCVLCGKNPIKKRRENKMHKPLETGYKMSFFFESVTLIINKLMGNKTQKV